MELTLIKGYREPVGADAVVLEEVLRGTNNGYLFAPSGWQVRVAREFPDGFMVAPQNGGRCGPWRIYPAH